MEDNPVEAVRNNVFGTLNVLRRARPRPAPSKFVLISTDKAVDPTSVMGATKRIAELHRAGLAVAREPRPTSRAVRFGNVLGSRRQRHPAVPAAARSAAAPSPSPTPRSPATS